MASRKRNGLYSKGWLLVNGRLPLTGMVSTKTNGPHCKEWLLPKGMDLFLAYITNFLFQIQKNLKSRKIFFSGSGAKLQYLKKIILITLNSSE